MSPHPVWQLEDLLADVPLRFGQRVLDLGSGRGATSVFLARELEVQVVAVDLWVPAAVAAAWHSPAWWARHWELSGLLTVTARWQDRGRRDWLRWSDVVCDQAPTPEARAAENRTVAMLRSVTDDEPGFALVSGVLPPHPAS